MKHNKLLLLLIFFAYSVTYAQDLPKEKFYQFSLDIQTNYDSDTVGVIIKNPLFCPLRVNLFSDYLKENKIINDTLKFLVPEKSEKVFKVYSKNLIHDKVNFPFIEVTLGDVNKKIKHNKLALPFPKGKTYQIMQSGEGSFSHDGDYNRFAIDFNTKIGDTITSADDGFVVGVIKDYEFGMEDRKWIPYANYITVYHPHSGLFTQYVHLKKDGSLVKVGDKVKRNQPIGLSGATGFVSGEHLHFNVLVPEKNGNLKSVPFTLKKNIQSKSLQKNMMLENR